MPRKYKYEVSKLIAENDIDTLRSWMNEWVNIPGIQNTLKDLGISTDLTNPEDFKVVLVLFYAVFTQEPAVWNVNFHFHPSLKEEAQKLREKQGPLSYILSTLFNITISANKNTLRSSLSNFEHRTGVTPNGDDLLPES
jgi:hypothetical protein